ncbi:MAG TPA: RNA-binding protein [Patescibacteria group bacterium]|nr:RNA-binding protein [Patescibacteria group bacterium]
MTKMFVGGLAYSINNQVLEDLFKKFGTVTSAQVISDRYTNQSKGFGFVEMADDAEAQKAIAELNGSSLEGRTINVSVARPKEDNNRGDSRNNRDNNSSGRDFFYKGKR